MSKLNTTMFDNQNRLDHSDSIKFRCVLNSQRPEDVHRQFSGAYYPRWRALYIDEVREICKKVKMFTVHPFDTYTNPEGELLLPADFELGAKFNLAAPPQSQRDDLPRSFVVNYVDKSRLSTALPLLREYFGKRQLPQDVVEDLITVRDAFIRMAGGVGELGLKSIARRFRVMDDDGNRVITRPEFEKALKECQLNFTRDRVDAVFRAFDRNSDNFLQYEEVLDVMRGPMNEGRKEVVRKVFKALDYDQDGHISIAEIYAKFTAADHPEVKNGTFTADQLLRGFLTTWDATHKAGLVSFGEFMDYYQGISAFVDSDDMFEAILRSSWKLRD